MQPDKRFYHVSLLLGPKDLSGSPCPRSDEGYHFFSWWKSVSLCTLIFDSQLEHPLVGPPPHSSLHQTLQEQRPWGLSALSTEATTVKFQTERQAVRQYGDEEMTKGALSNTFCYNPVLPG